MKLKLHWQIAIALAAAVAAGLLSARNPQPFGVPLAAIYDFFGTLFLNALKMLVVPLVLTSIITGVAGIGRAGAIGRLGGRALVYYATTSLIAILVGLGLVNLLAPGRDSGLTIGGALNAAQSAQLQDRGLGELWGVFLQMIPPNVIAAAAEGQMLGLITFSLLFGYFMTRISPPLAEVQQRFWQGAFEIMMRITDWVMRFAPVGVFALVAKVVMLSGPEVFRPVFWFAVTVVLGLALHLLVVLPLILALVARVSPRRHFQAMMPALLTAFSTSSSSATLPLTMECVEKNAGVSNRVSSFVLPLGATVNMDGTALYECVAAMFIAQVYGIELGFAQQFTIVVIALLTSIGVAGIPSASLVAIAIILAAIGLPAEGIGLLLAVDRVLDMLRTSVNIFSDSCGAVLIARLEGEQVLMPGSAKTP